MSHIPSTPVSVEPGRAPAPAGATAQRVWAPSTAADPTLVPRDGHTLRVLVVARISTAHQDARSLDDQAALCRRWVADRHPGPAAVRVIAGRGSGEHLDRQELAEAEAAVEAGDLDLVVVEDLGRVCRRNRAVDFCELCEDHDTRLVAINDHVDTADDRWRLGAFFASFKHETSNADTARRIRRTLRNRFAAGGVVQIVPFGYLKPAAHCPDADLRKDPAAAPVIERVFALLEDGASFAEVADRLAADRVPVGRWVRSGRWSAWLVANLVRNPLLKGVRVRNAVVTKRVNRTGRSRKVPAPPGERLERPCPHLAFVTPERFDRLQAVLAERGRASRFLAGKVRPPGRPARRTVWPAGHLVCGACGRPLRWNAHGQKGRLVCVGSAKHRCWNSVSMPGQRAAERLCEAVLTAAEALPEYDADLRRRVLAAHAAGVEAASAAAARAVAETAEATAAVARLVDAVTAAGHSPALLDRLAAAERHLAGLRAVRPAAPPPPPALPPAAELRARVRAAVARLAFDDPAFGREMQRLLPRLVAVPVRRKDGGRPVLRALVSLDPGGLVAGGQAVARELTVDLTDPPKLERLRAEARRRRAAGETLPTMAAALGVHVRTLVDALRLDRLVGDGDPYELLTGPPPDDRKRTRHRRVRFRYEPLPGYPVWQPAGAG